MTSSPDWKARYEQAVTVVADEIARLKGITTSGEDGAFNAKIFVKPLIIYIQTLKKAMTAKNGE